MAPGALQSVEDLGLLPPLKAGLEPGILNQEPWRVHIYILLPRLPQGYSALHLEERSGDLLIKGIYGDVVTL